MASSATAANRGDGYLVWFDGGGRRVVAYEVVADALFTRAEAPVDVDDQWATYRVEYDPATGRLDVYRGAQSLLTWTDPSPAATGSYLSLRTNATAVEFDDLKVYKSRGSTATVTAGEDNTRDLRRADGKVKSIVRDAAGNFSARANLDVTTGLAGRSAPQTTATSTPAAATAAAAFPNPAHGGALFVRYAAAGEAPAELTLRTAAGQTVTALTDAPGTPGTRLVDARALLDGRPAAGFYVLEVRHGGYSEFVPLLLE